MAKDLELKKRILCLVLILINIENLDLWIHHHFETDTYFVGILGCHVSLTLK